MSITVNNQQELDKALASKEAVIYIDSGAGVWMSVRDSGSSRVVARGSSSVEARGSSRVEAWDSSSVEAWDSSRVEAGKYVAVHLHSKRVTITGGVVIDITDLDMSDRATWLDFHGVTIRDGSAVLYKAVDENLDAGHRHTVTRYAIGESVSASDWRADSECGHGLHLGLSPAIARAYFPDATRFLECEVDASTLVPLGDKAKSESVRVVREVTVHREAVS